MSQTDPSPSVFFATKTSFTKVPSGLNTWMRSLGRSQTYSRPSCESSAQCTGLRNCCAGGSVGIVAAERRIVGLVAVGAPVALVLAGLGIEDDDAVVAVAIGHVQFVGLRVDVHLGRALQVLDVVAALALAGLADLHQKLARLGELQDHVVVEIAGCGLAFRRRSPRAPAPRAARRHCRERGGRCRRSRRCLCSRR